MLSSSLNLIYVMVLFFVLLWQIHSRESSMARMMKPDPPFGSAGTGRPTPGGRTASGEQVAWFLGDGHECATRCAPSRAVAPRPRRAVSARRHGSHAAG